MLGGEEETNRFIFRAFSFTHSIITFSFRVDFSHPPSSTLSFSPFIDVLLCAFGVGQARELLSFISFHFHDSHSFPSLHSAAKEGLVDYLVGSLGCWWGGMGVMGAA